MYEDDGLDGLLSLGALALGALGIGALINHNKKREEEEKQKEEESHKYWEAWREKEERRKTSAPIYTEGVTEDDMRRIINDATKWNKRLISCEFDPNRLLITCKMRSNTGSTKWKFELDFNNFGHIDGTYRITQENKDSPIPKSMAEDIADEIKKLRTIHEPENE